MLNLMLSLLSVVSFSAGENAPYRFYKNITYQAQQVFIVVDDNSNLYEYQIDYTFYTDISYNNQSSYEYKYNGFNIDLKIINDNGTQVYSYNESFYEEIVRYITNNTFYIEYDFAYPDNVTSLMIKFEFGANDTVWYIPLENYGLNPLLFPFSTDTVLNWTPITQNLIPAIMMSDSYDIGYYNGYQLGFDDGDRAGQITGYSHGYADAQSDDSVPSIIFAGILNIAMVPVNFFLAILNFEVFGINIGGFVTGLMTIAVIIILFGVIFGGRPAPSGGPSGGGKNG